MTELERHPQAARQGAAAVAVVVFTAAGMPAMAMRAEAQRTDADWAARASAFNKFLASDTAAAAPTAMLAFDVAPTAEGWRAHGQSLLEGDGLDGRAITVSARVRDSVALAALRTRQAPDASGRFAREQRCLAEAVYYEARGESRLGQLAVAEVVSNRVRSRLYPDTYCGVVYQGSERDTGCQFSFTCDGSTKSRPRGAAWREANAVSSEVMMGLVQPFTHRSTHYHARSVDPYWSANLVETARIGGHIFYRLPSRREREEMAAEREAGAAEDSAAQPAAEVTPTSVTAPADAPKPDRVKGSIEDLRA